MMQHTQKQAPFTLLDSKETIRYGVLCGLALSHSDFNTYLTYYLIADTGRGDSCDFFVVYASMYIISSIIDSIWTVFIGWFVDKYERHAATWLNVMAILEIITALIVYPLHRYPIGHLLSYLIHMMCITQMNTGVWKAVKLRINHAKLRAGTHGDDDGMLDENHAVSSIGNICDITADIVEGIALFLCYLLAHLGFRFELVLHVLFAALLFYAVLVAVMTFSLNPEHFSSVDDYSSDAGNILQASQPITLAGIMEKVKEFYRNKLVWHGCWHAVLVAALYNVITYPLTISNVSTDDTYSHGTVPSAMTSSNYCNGELILVLRQGSIINTLFLVGSFFYRKVLLPMQPTSFYELGLPVLGLGIGICLTFLFVFPHGVIASLLLAVGQLIPYWINSYCYFVFTSAVNPHTYGFVLGVYSIACQFVYYAVYMIVAAKVHMTMLVVLSLLLAVCAVLYGQRLQKLMSMMSNNAISNDGQVVLEKTDPGRTTGSDSVSLKDDSDSDTYVHTRGTSIIKIV